MDVETWRNSEKVIKKSRKHYAHFDYRTSLADKWEYISVPYNVAKHSFYPFIHYKQEFDKYNPVTKKKKPKLREICYAAHVDSCIYQYYSFLLNELYNQRVGRDGISDVPVAYRTDLGKNNVYFAKAAIDFIRQCKSCYVMIGDFTNFTVKLIKVRKERKKSSPKRLRLTFFKQVLALMSPHILRASISSP